MNDPTLIDLPFRGGCICQAIRYECSSKPLAMFNCHCRDCQQTGGGPYAPIVVVSLKSLVFVRGAPRRHATTRLSGRPNLRGFCGTCGSRLTVGEDPARDLIGLMAASLDDPRWFEPSMNIFANDAQPWDLLDEKLLKYQQHKPRH